MIWDTSPVPLSAAPPWVFPVSSLVCHQKHPPGPAWGQSPAPEPWECPSHSVVSCLQLLGCSPSQLCPWQGGEFIPCHPDFPVGIFTELCHRCVPVPAAPCRRGFLGCSIPGKPISSPSPSQIECFIIYLCIFLSIIFLISQFTPTDPSL